MAKRQVQKVVSDPVLAIRQRIDKSRSEILTAVESLYRTRLALAELRELARELDGGGGGDPILEVLTKESHRVRETLQNAIDLVLDEQQLLERMARWLGFPSS